MAQIKFFGVMLSISKRLTISDTASGVPTFVYLRLFTVFTALHWVLGTFYCFLVCPPPHNYSGYRHQQQLHIECQ